MKHFNRKESSKKDIKNKLSVCNFCVVFFVQAPVHTLAVYSVRFPSLPVHHGTPSFSRSVSHVTSHNSLFENVHELMGELQII